NDCKFCNNWAHNEFVNFGTEKMSKSLGNVITIRKFTETYSGAILRHVVLSVHYRSKQDWTEEMISKAISEIERIHEFAIHLFGEQKFVAEDDVELKKVQQAFKDIKHEMGNDFNVPGALGVFFGVIKDYNRLSKIGIGQNYTFAVIEIVNFMKAATGLVHDYPEEVLRQLNLARKHLSGTTDDTSDSEIEDLLVERKEARATKNWAKSDEIRERLNQLGVVVKDNPDGSYTWSFK
ncbi:MAG: class I tRNA ligase family protein, partial [Bdellovibrionales bacterium]|nr:class I tRNA ligase family protein [Bdellovibrionales bacterium]